VTIVDGTLVPTRDHLLAARLSVVRLPTPPALWVLPQRIEGLVSHARGRSRCAVDSVILLGALVAGILALVILYTTTPGRRFRHWMHYRMLRGVWRNGQAVVNLRVVDGTQEGLRGRRWYGGAALATPGRVEFTMWVGGLPLVKRPIPGIVVTAVGTARRVRGLDKVKFMEPDYQVALLRTPTATLEIAVAPPVPGETVLARLRSPGMPRL
jgi:hypothetical protein